MNATGHQQSCGLCSSCEGVSEFELNIGQFQGKAPICEVCRSQLNTPSTMAPRHWEKLRESIWSDDQVVKILCFKALNELVNRKAGGVFEGLLADLYMEDELLQLANSYSLGADNKTAAVIVKDSVGQILNQGDAVTLIKDLDVKGANFTAKRGTLVKNIVLTDDPALIEGRVNGTMIVLKTCFLKKA